MRAADAPNLVLVRHAESEWNVRGLATGWADVPLTARGREQAAAAGRQLAADGTRADVLYTSMLRRAQQTAACLLDAWGLAPGPVIALWQLNERHVGQLQGLDKPTIKHRWGNRQRHRWRSDFDALPPPLDPDDPRHPRHDPRFRKLPRGLLPASESIADLRRRVLTGWHTHIVPQLAAGRHVAVVGHRDSLRVLIAELEALHDSQFARIEVPPASPRTYRMCGQPGRDFGRSADAPHRHSAAYPHPDPGRASPARTRSTLRLRGHP